MISVLSANIQRKIWGGTKLAGMKRIVEEVNNVENIGETWEISNHKDGPALINNIPLDPALNLTYLVKLIDTSDELSIQVHPGDEYARKYENSFGKSECWLILEAEDKAGIYLGLKKGVSKDQFLDSLNKKERMDQFLNFYEVKPGDFFYVPAGSIHAIGRGITLAEVQQNSGITYRVWDWNRVDSNGNPRELHVQKSLDVINFNEEANSKDHFRVKHGLFNLKGLQEIINHEAFRFSLVNLDENEELEISLNSNKRLKSILNLQSKIIVNGVEVLPYQSILIDNESSLKINSVNKSNIVLVE